MGGDLKEVVSDRLKRIWVIVTEPVDHSWDSHSHRDQNEPGLVQNPRRRSRPLTEDDVESFLDAAEMREDPIWEAIDLYLKGPLWYRSPTRSKMLLKEIYWMRRMAAKDRLDWGIHD